MKLIFFRVYSLPFGVELDQRHGTENTERYKFGFQGQLLDDDIKGDGNSASYKYRMNDPRLGRFFAVDPLAAKYAYNSPYAFSENCVINAVELEGLEKIDYYQAGLDKDGKYEQTFLGTYTLEGLEVDLIKIEMMTMENGDLDQWIEVEQIIYKTKEPGLKITYDSYGEITPQIIKDAFNPVKTVAPVKVKTPEPKLVDFYNERIDESYNKGNYSDALYYKMQKLSNVTLAEGEEGARNFSAGVNYVGIIVTYICPPVGGSFCFLSDVMDTSIDLGTDNPYAVSNLFIRAGTMAVGTLIGNGTGAAAENGILSKGGQNVIEGAGNLGGELIEDGTTKTADDD